MTHHVGLDGAVGGGVGDAGEDEAVAHLVVIEEGLVGLVDGTGLLRLGRVAWARGGAVSARPNVRRSFILNSGYNVFFWRIRERECGAVGGTYGDLARAGGAGTRAAGVGEVNAGLLLR